MTEGLDKNPFKSMKARQGNLKRKSSGHMNSAANKESSLDKDTRDKQKTGLNKNLVGSAGLGASK